MALKRDDLTLLDIRVLETLTESTRSTGTVRLAADMWRNDDFAMGADPVGLVQHLVAHLCEMGLVKYSEKPMPKFHEAIWHDWPEPPSYAGLAHDIRLTQAGWALMGYPNIVPEVGQRMSTRLVLDPKGDRTNFRKHGHSAEGSAIEVDDFPTHQRNYPHHIHDYERTDPLMTRPYVKVTDELEGTVLAYRTRFPLADYQTIADETGIPKRTIQYILTDLPRKRHMVDLANGDMTQKERILQALESLDFKDVPNLIKALGRGDSAHDIVHALHDLKKQGLVTFSDNANAKTPANIKMSARGRKSADTSPRVIVGESLEEQTARFEATKGIPVISPLRAEETVMVEIENSDEQGYPLLQDLLDRETKRLTLDQKAMRYLEAADLIRETDPETAALLDAKAKESDIPYPNPLEAEYLRFFRGTPMTLVPRE